MARKQAKVLSPAQMRALLVHVEAGRYPSRDRVMVLLAFRAGLRAAEIASLEWSMVTDAGGVVSDTLAIEDRIAKRGGGGSVPLARDLREALVTLRAERAPEDGDRIIYSERGRSMTAHGVVQWFRRKFHELGYAGATSHSGRRTFITGAARRISTVGGSLRDVQELARHRSLVVTARYIEASADAKRRVVELT